MFDTNTTLEHSTLLSPNYSKRTSNKLKYIIVHCVVGQHSSLQTANGFTDPKRGASSNYIVGKDGDICLCVEEKNRAWTTGGVDKNKKVIYVNGKSGAIVDHSGITIEVASDTTKPYAFRDVAFNKTIELVAEILKRNNKNKILFISDKNEATLYEPKENEVLLMYHRWFSTHSCPGDWFIGKTPEFVNEVNKRLGNVEIKPNDEVKQTDNETIIWDYLKSKINNSYGVAGLMGNLQAESALRPNNLQNSYESKLGYNDDTYTQAVDNGSYTNFVRDSSGYGLAQWTYWSRKQNLLNFKNNSNKSIGDLSLQLDFLFNELSTSYKGVLNGLVNSRSVKEASDIVLTRFERPKDQSDNVKNKRCQLGQEIYNRHVDLTTKQNNDIIYIVKPGDTLSKIAKQYNTTYQKIAVDNKIANPNVIRVGQKLTIKP